MYESITLVANLGSDPVMKYMPNGNAVVNFSVATNRQYTKNDGEKVKETTWWRVSAFGKTAEACNTYLKKGSKVLIEGRMNSEQVSGGPRIWTNDAGEPKASYEITASTIRFLDSRSNGERKPRADDQYNETDNPAGDTW